MQSEDFSQPVTSSWWRAQAGPTRGAHIAEALGGELDVFLFLPVAFRPTVLSGFSQQVVDLTNDERARAGCQPLSVSPQLADAAQAHSEDMARNDFFSHTGSDGSSPGDRIAATGYEWREAGENIAAGYTSPRAVVDAWMDSDGHRANILRCSFQEIGVGYIYLESDTGDVNYRHYWTQLFARPG